MTTPTKDEIMARAALGEAQALMRQLRDGRDQARTEAERLRDRLATFNECVRIYVGHRDAGSATRPGWLEEEIAATDPLLNA